jgi:hypothetical protein
MPLMNLSHAPTLGLSLMTAFAEVGPRYGVRLEGIEDDANEHSDFWQQVAREVLKDGDRFRPASRTGEQEQ